ncbi:MAG: methylated-DNA--[Oscillospiraceae bacterium]|nr:methylated-DNA--[protein]-cysteine S-methyltransferase [Oscillospiraceae bacterium]
MKTLCFDSPLGKLSIGEENGALVFLSFGGPESADETPLLLETKRQILEYFAGRRKSFDVPLCTQGTAFQKRVWDAMTQIPYGETRSYSQIAEQIGSPRACRAVGTACNRNPIAIIVPCHRVIGASGMLVGYEYGLDAKKYLLSLEKMY